MVTAVPGPSGWPLYVIVGDGVTRTLAVTGGYLADASWQRLAGAETPEPVGSR